MYIYCLYDRVPLIVVSNSQLYFGKSVLSRIIISTRGTSAKTFEPVPLILAVLESKS